MRILWIKTELLHPVDKGGRIRTYQMLRSIARDHHVTYLCLDDGQAAADARSRATEYCAEVVTVPFHPARKMSFWYFLDLLRNVASSLPYAVSRYRSPAMRTQVERLAGRMDLVICDFLFPSQNVPRGLDVTTVLFQHNVEAMIWQRHVDVPQNAVRRVYMREQWRRMRRFEGVECRRFNHVVAVSDSDALTMAREYRLTSVSSIPTGVDLEYFAAPTSRPSTDPELVFVGSMDWMPNEDGIRWFTECVFGLVRQRVPDARLTIVGRSPSAAIRKLAARVGGVEVTGTVPDVRPYLARGAVSVVPLRIGGGTRLKIYEAMAMGIPLVATAIGAEGLPVERGKHLLIADTPDEQAEAIVALLQDRDRARAIASNALLFVRENCSWDAVARLFISKCINQRESRSSVYKDLVA